MITGCGTEKEKPALQRAWLGGEYRPAGKKPKQIAGCPKAALWLTAVNTNTPASAAGLQKGDLIVELNHQHFTSLRDFHRKIDRGEPGSTLPIAVWRDGQITNFDVTLGREKFRHEGTFTVYAPCVVHGWQFWRENGRPGFSLVVLGYSANPGVLREHGQVEKKNPDGIQTTDSSYNEEYEIWLALFQVNKGERILSQEKVEPRAGG